MQNLVILYNPYYRQEVIEDHIQILNQEAFPGANPMVKIEELIRTPIFVETLKFGKYKKLKTVEAYNEDVGYIRLMMDKMDLDVDMKYTFNKIIGHI